MGTGQAQPAYWQQPEYDDPLIDFGTDTDTSSDSGHEDVDMSDIRNIIEPEAAEHVYLQCRKYRRKWALLAKLLHLHYLALES